MEVIENLIGHATKITETIGIAFIFLGVIYALGSYVIRRIRRIENCYKQLRILLGKVIILGLEILIAADIMATVVTKPELSEVMALGLIVIIRIVLSLAIQVELEGQFPWQRKEKKDVL